MTDWAPKRFWSKEQVEQCGDGFSVLLDGRPVMTPTKNKLIVPTEALATAIADEWAQQEEKIDPATMPLTRTANSAIDKVKPQRSEVVQMLAAYGDADLLCYRATHPEKLVERQAQSWDPLLAWAEEEFGARLEPRKGVMHVPQNPDPLRLLAEQVDQLDPFRLAGFHDLVCLTGSLVIGLAVTRRMKPDAELWDAATIDENWQLEVWGQDDEAAETLIRKRNAFDNAAQFYRLATG